MWASIQSGCIYNLTAAMVSVEADLQSGLPSFGIVGLPDPLIRESKDRVRSALRNAGFEFPMKRITVNLSPATIKKEGSAFDLAIALSLLFAENQWDVSPLSKTVFIGELSLKGEVRSVRGVMPLVLAAKKAGHTTVFVPLKNGREARMVSGMTVFGVKLLQEVVLHLRGDTRLSPIFFTDSPQPSKKESRDFSDVVGHRWAKRGLEIAAAGGHHLLMMGPPGCGKSMLAKRLSTILPPLSQEEALEVTQIYSIAGDGVSRLLARRPFQEPHHTVTHAAMIGGGSKRLTPGEITFAHNGVLFLDELPEFRRDVLESLREPLESGGISISRVHGRCRLPSRFMLVAAMNPCPCGYDGNPEMNCVCTEQQVTRYRYKLSGPLLDRIDIQMRVSRVDPNAVHPQASEKSALVLERVKQARALQQQRFTDTPFHTNAQIAAKSIQHFCFLEEPAKKLLHKVVEKMGFSYRVYHRLLKLARTIADLEGAKAIRQQDISEAIQLRIFDKKNIGM